jgi:four helix bundle protein
MIPYERFDSWKLTHKLALQVYEVTEKWPGSERYGLTAQIRRAALSAPTNIAEGSAKRGILNQADFGMLEDLRDQAGKLTWRLYASLSPTRGS